MNFGVRNAPKEEFGKIGIFGWELRNMTPNEWLQRTRYMDIINGKVGIYAEACKK